jgi:hypothetical protein
MAMKNVLSRARLMLLGGAVLGIMLTVSSDRVAAGQPAPDCGPTREWNCVVPGCPDCPEILFEGTVCEKAAFEKKTGRVCSPE